jgi:hypothetical protein
VVRDGETAFEVIANGDGGCRSGASLIADAQIHPAAAYPQRHGSLATCTAHH